MNETKWISVNEKLPKSYERVLVSCQAKKGTKSINMAYIDSLGGWHGMGSMAGVTAWMSLPEPYEGDKIS